MKQRLYELLFPFFWGIASICLLLFSYTQVDLSLTLSRANIYQEIEKTFQHIGYFQRPLAASLYIILLVLFFILYGVSLWAVAKKKMRMQTLWWSVGIMVAILVFSYPAFSYDMFNYMFTAKTVLFYHKNPYTVVPLQFAGVEPWLSFMHWTHLPSAYTLLWILLTLPAYVLGFGYFLVIMWNIKVLVALFYILTIYYIGKSLSKVEPERAIFGMAIFAFNPLIIFETLVSGHNDVVMMGIVIMAYYLYLQKRYWTSFLALSASVAAKLMTFFVLPIFFLGWKRVWALWAMIIGFGLVAIQREILPWYVVWLVPFYALLPRAGWARDIGTGLSFGLLLSYAPFFYYGDYTGPVPALKLWATLTPLILSFLWVIVQRVNVNKK